MAAILGALGSVGLIGYENLIRYTHVECKDEYLPFFTTEVEAIHEQIHEEDNDGYYHRNESYKRL